MGFDLLFPGNRQVEPITLTDVKSVVIVGANGSGKSRLGMWIEGYGRRHLPSKPNLLIHRITAQRLLTVHDNIRLAPVKVALDHLLYGSANVTMQGDLWRVKTNERWQSNPFTMVLDDFEPALSLLLARQNEVAYNYWEEAKSTAHKPPIIETPLDKFKKIWEDLFPHRVLDVNVLEGRIFADDPHKPITGPQPQAYHLSQMSDGERVALYLMAQCLCLPPQTILVVDEPEIHLHKAVITKLWDRLEAERDDCIFVYLTHDLEFASSRVNATKIWLKSYTGGVWDYEIVPDSPDIPEDVVLTILGSRKPVLLVEGNKGSHDYAIYKSVYPEHFLIPVGGSDDVIRVTKALAKMSLAHHWFVCGLIDRDHRSDEEVENLKKYSVFCTDVAEVENLLCVPEVLKICAEKNFAHQDHQDILNDVTDIVLRKMNENKEQQCASRTANEILFQMNKRFNVNQKSGNDVKKTFESLKDEIDVDKIHARNLQHYEDAINHRDLSKALRLYNNKGLAGEIGGIVFQYSDYINLIKRELIINPDLVGAIQAYLPEIPVKANAETDST